MQRIFAFENVEVDSAIMIFVQAGGTKNTFAVKVPPMLPLQWLVSEKKCDNLEFRFHLKPRQ